MTVKEMVCGVEIYLDDELQSMEQKEIRYDYFLEYVMEVYRMKKCLPDQLFLYQQSNNHVVIINGYCYNYSIFKNLLERQGKKYIENIKEVLK